MNMKSHYNLIFCLIHLFEGKRDISYTKLKSWKSDGEGRLHKLVTTWWNSSWVRSKITTGQGWTFIEKPGSKEPLTLWILIQQVPVQCTSYLMMECLVEWKANWFITDLYKPYPKLYVCLPNRSTVYLSSNLTNQVLETSSPSTSSISLNTGEPSIVPVEAL